MALKRQAVEHYLGTDTNIVLTSITDAAGAAINWTGYAAIEFRMSATRGGATAVFTKSLGDMTATSTTLTIPVLDTDISGESEGLYWWELAADDQMIVAPSKYWVRASSS